MTAAGNIVIDLLMRTGSFETDSKRAQKSLRDLNKEAIEFARGAATALLGLTGAATAAFFALESGASAIAKFKDLGDVMGDTGEAIASLKSAADVSGTSMDTIADASVKLTKALSKVDEESEGAAKALAALGIPLKDFKALSPVQQIEALSNALAGFKSDKGATEVMEALVRGGSRLIPLLKELQQQGGPKVIITQDQIEAADRFADTVGLLKSQVVQLGQSVLADLLPPFQAFVDEVGKAENALSIFSVAGSAVRIFFETITVLGANVIFVFEGVGREIGGIAAQLAALAKFDLSGFNAISKAMKEDAAKARAELDRFEQRILGATDAASKERAQRRIEDRGFDPRKSIDTSGLAVSSASKDDPTKKLLDNALKEQEAAIKREQALLSERNRFLDLFNSQNLLSIRSYYDAQQAIIDAATSSQKAAYDKQLDILETARQKATKQTDVAELTGKIDDTIEKRAELERKAGADSLALSFKRAEAEKRYKDQIDAVRASVLELQGDLAGAAAIRFDLQNADLLKKAFNEGDAAAQQYILHLRDASIAQAQFNKAAQDYDKVLSSLAFREDRIQISRQLGATTELGALKQVGEARQAAVAQMRAMVEAQEAIAKASGNPALVQNAERARLELERLVAVADPLGDKFRSIFADAGTTGIEILLDDISRGKDALKAFGDQVTREINRIVAQNASEALFGKQGVFGDLLGSFSGLFGGTGGGAGAASVTASVTAETTARTTSTASLVAFTAALQAATAALAQQASTSALEGFDLGIFFAAGGDPPVGRRAVGGERGRELFVPKSVQTVSGLSLIGEHGPTLFRPTVPGTVIPADDTERILRLFGGAFAGGGDPTPGMFSLGGEHGRELFVPRTRGMAPPKFNGERSAMRQVVVQPTFILAEKPSLQTQQQIAVKTGQSVSRALARGSA